MTATFFSGRLSHCPPRLSQKHSLMSVVSRYALTIFAVLFLLSVQLAHANEVSYAIDHVSHTFDGVVGRRIVVLLTITNRDLKAPPTFTLKTSYDTTIRFAGATGVSSLVGSVSCSHIESNIENVKFTCAPLIPKGSNYYVKISFITVYGAAGWLNYLPTDAITLDESSGATLNLLPVAPLSSPLPYRHVNDMTTLFYENVVASPVIGGESTFRFTFDIDKVIDGATFTFITPSTLATSL